MLVKHIVNCDVRQLYAEVMMHFHVDYENFMKRIDLWLRSILFNEGKTTFEKSRTEILVIL